MIDIMSIGRLLAVMNMPPERFCRPTADEQKTVHVSPTETRGVLIELADMENDGSGLCRPARETIAERRMCSVKTVERALIELRDLGLIDWTTGHTAWANAYSFKFPKKPYRRTKHGEWVEDARPSVDPRSENKTEVRPTVAPITVNHGNNHGEPFSPTAGLSAPMTKRPTAVETAELFAALVQITGQNPSKATTRSNIQRRAETLYEKGKTAADVKKLESAWFGVMGNTRPPNLLEVEYNV